MIAAVFAQRATEMQRQPYAAAFRTRDFGGFFLGRLRRLVHSGAAHSSGGPNPSFGKTSRRNAFDPATAIWRRNAASAAGSLHDTGSEFKMFEPSMIVELESRQT